MSFFRPTISLLALSLSLASGCTQSPPPAAPSRTALSDMDIFSYLKNHNVNPQPQIAADDFSLGVSVLLPPRWAASQAYADIYLLLENARATDQQFRPNAVLSVFKVEGDFDPQQAILRGFVSIISTPGFHTLRQSLDDFQGYPSAVIEGTYVNDEKHRREDKARIDEIQRQNDVEPDPEEPEGDLTLHVLNRYILASSNQEKFLVQLQITVTEQQAEALSPDIKALDQGIKLSFSS